MYRLHFCRKTAKWVLQFLHFGLFWVTVKQSDKVLTFETLLEAQTFVTSHGIDKMYDQWSTKGRNAAYVLGVVEQRVTA